MTFEFDLGAALSESAARGPGMPRGPSVTALLQTIALNGVPSGIDWERLREILLAEVNLAMSVALKVHKYQLDNGASKPRSNQQYFDESSLLEELQADAEYLAQQLRQLHRPPFTVQRLAEVLLRPFQFHTRSAAKALSPPMGCTDVELELQLDDGEGISDDDIGRREAWTFQLTALRPTLLFFAIRKLVLVMPVDSVS